MPTYIFLPPAQEGKRFSLIIFNFDFYVRSVPPSGRSSTLSLCLSFSFSPLRGRRQCRRRRRHKITFHHFSSFFTQNFQTKTNETVSPEAFKKIPEKLSREAEKKDLNGNCGNFQVCDLEQPKVCGRLSAINIFGSLPERWNI